MSDIITLHRLDGTLDNIHDTRAGVNFDMEAYSLMKHGDTDALTKAGRDLADRILTERPDLATTSRDVILPVAYMAVPPSCYFLAEACAARLSEARGILRNTPARVTRISKDSVTTRDYAASSQADREAEMKSISFTLDEPVEDAIVVLVDDVRVTGLAERTAVAAIMKGNPEEVILGYVAVVEGELRTTPQVESVLNHHTVTSILDMIPAVEEGRFSLTIRFLKRVLKSSLEEVTQFASSVPTSLLDEMIKGAYDSGVEFAESHRPTLNILEKERAAHVAG